MTSPIEPCGFYILIKMQEVNDKFGAIELPQSMIDSEQRGFDKGVVIAVGPTAYLAYKGAQEGETPDDRAAIWGCKPDDTVIFQKNAGKLMENSAQVGEDEWKHLRLIVDSQIMANVKEKQA